MDQSLFFSLIQNAALLLAMVFVYDAFPRSHKRELDVLWRVGIGALVGVISISVMLSPWQYTEGVFLIQEPLSLVFQGCFSVGSPHLSL